MNIFLLGAFLFSSLFIRNFGFSFFSRTESIKIPTSQIKVLLHKLQVGSSLQLSSKKGFMIIDKNKKTKLSTCQLTIAYKKNMVSINGISYKNQITINPLDQLFECDKKTYQGAIILKFENAKLLVVNQLNLEDYVFSVLKTESWPGWPLEMNKVQAIVCRTYVLAMIQDAEKTKRPFHVTSTNLFQTYSGMHTNQTIRKAIDETKNMILHYNKKPILAMYDSCCGGVIPAYMHHFDMTKNPYLARKYACKYCKTCSIYSWKTSIPLEQFAKKLEQNHQKVCSIKVTKDKAGLTKEVALKGKGFSTTISGQQLYSFSKDIKSYCFDISKKSNSLIFSGRGYGHHMGLCQWGACEMVKKGYSCKKILEYYFPGAALGKVI